MVFHLVFALLLLFSILTYFKYNEFFIEDIGVNDDRNLKYYYTKDRKNEQLNSLWYAISPIETDIANGTSSKSYLYGQDPRLLEKMVRDNLLTTAQKVNLDRNKWLVFKPRFIPRNVYQTIITTFMEKSKLYSNGYILINQRVINASTNNDSDYLLTMQFIVKYDAVIYAKVFTVTLLFSNNKNTVYFLEVSLVGVIHEQYLVVQ